MIAPVRYAPFFCEENVWQLCAPDASLPESATAPGAPLALPPVAERRAVFITNAAQAVAMWGQRAGARTGGMVVWDYHVVLAGRALGTWWIWDLDCTAGYPVSLDAYAALSFGPLSAGAADVETAAHRAMFRVVDARAFHAAFSTDRSHMRTPAGGERVPFPPWPAPFHAAAGMQLHRYLDLDDAVAGRVVAMDALVAALAHPDTASPNA